MPWPKARWPVRVAADVEPVGVGEPRRVAVGRAERDQHRSPRRDERRRRSRRPRREAAGGVVDRAVERSSSSTAPAAATGRRAARPARRGGAAAPVVPLPIRLTVVSCPATAAGTALPSSSSLASRSPASSGRRSGADAGRRRVGAAWPRSAVKYAGHRRRRVPRSARLDRWTRWPCDQARNRPVLVGHAEQLADHRDRQREGERRQQVNLAAGGHPSSSEAVISVTRGRSCSTRRAVNALVTSRRSRS